MKKKKGKPKAPKKDPVLNDLILDVIYKMHTGDLTKIDDIITYVYKIGRLNGQADQLCSKKPLR